MTKNLYVAFFLGIIMVLSFNATAETKKDCSQYSSKTFAGLADKMRCKKGLEPTKNIFKSISLRKKTSEPKVKKACNEHTTKTIAGLIGKLKCRTKK
jgi:hypothetical protein|tara:strand:+ start:191 stop:481 length:291 start_codon:yes stop_codon:yes gene_type:complete